VGCSLLEVKAGTFFSHHLKKEYEEEGYGMSPASWRSKPGLFFPSSKKGRGRGRI